MTKLFLALICFGAVSPVFGQQDSTMNQSMRLEREFTPTIHQSRKIDRQPAAISTATEVAKEQHRFADFEPNVVSSNEIQTVPVGQVIAPKESDSMGYVKLAMGNYWNTDVQAGIQMGDFSIDALGFFYKGTLDIPTDLPVDLNPKWTEWNSRYLNGQVVGTYSKTLSNQAQLTAHLGGYGHTCEPMVMQSKVTHFGKAATDIQYETDQWKIFLGYHFNGSTLLDGTGNVSNTGMLATGAENTDHSSQHVIEAKVRSGIYDRNPNWQAWADIHATQTFAKSSFFAIKPTLNVRYIPVEGVWRSIYASFGSGTRREDLYETLVTSPLVAGSVDYKNSFDVIDARLGYEDNENGVFQWGAEVSVKSVTNALCGTAQLNADKTNNQLNGVYIRLSNEDNFSFGVKVHATLEANQYFGAKAYFSYTTYTEDAGAFVKPRVETGLHLVSNPGRFHFDLGVDAGLDRKMETLVPTLNLVTHPSGYYAKLYELDPLWNLKMLAEYNVLNNLKVFLVGNNLLNQKQQLWSGVPAELIDFQLGASYRF